MSKQPTIKLPRLLGKVSKAQLEENMIALPAKEKTKSFYRANFLWPHTKGSVEEAGYEFANGATEEYRKVWWEILKQRIVERVGNIG